MESQIVIRKLEQSDLGIINDFIINNEWPYHSTAITEAKPLVYFSNDAMTLLAEKDKELLGYIRVEEFIDGDSPLFDIRISEKARGKGLGETLVKQAETVVFSELPNTVRFEGTTRIDNLPMIRLFEKLSWVKEAHYRMGWRLSNNNFCDALGYSILREEWERR
jgi:RimJ/RimL family protein N-acetyltransferase